MYSSSRQCSAICASDTCAPEPCDYWLSAIVSPFLSFSRMPQGPPARPSARRPVRAAPRACGAHRPIAPGVSGPCYRRVVTALTSV